jgi:hypothetical protein
MRALVLGVAILALSVVVASAQETVYPRHGYAPYGLHYAGGSGYRGYYHHRYYAYYPRYHHRRHWYRY